MVERSTLPAIVTIRLGESTLDLLRTVVMTHLATKDEYTLDPLHVVVSPRHVTKKEYTLHTLSNLRLHQDNDPVPNGIGRGCI